MPKYTIIPEQSQDATTDAKRRKITLDNAQQPVVDILERRANEEYTVGWVCALPKERTAATAMLDYRHADILKPPNDPNTYTLGSIGKHNVVVACLPKGMIGNNSAATVATWMISTFPSIKFGLMVGIGGGVPPKVRLGDVVVSTPVGQFPGVVQLDLGKAKVGGEFERTGSLNNPPCALLAALTKLETDHDLTGSRIPEYLDEIRQKWPRLVPKYLRSDSLDDVLFNSNYPHASKNSLDTAAIPDDDEDEEGEEDQGEEDDSCRFCDKARIVKRKPREMRVLYGLIASGNQVIKDASFRDRLNKDLGGQVLCVEMEAAGLMNNFPCIVIRGICDYADSHKNKIWQEYAATVAAAFAKELLQYVEPSDIDTERTAKDILGQVQDNVKRIGVNVEGINSKLDGREDYNILEWLTAVDYGPQQSDYFNEGHLGTGKWLLDSTEFLAWLQTDKQTLFCPGIPGAGKTILTSIVIDNLINHFVEDKTIGMAYLYCNFKRKDEQKADDLLVNLLKQLAQRRSSLPESVRSLYERHKGKRTRPSFDEVSKSLQSVAALYSRVFIIIDALDECQTSDGCRTKLLAEIFNLQTKHKANIFATSRFVLEVSTIFSQSISLEIRASDKDVQRYLEGHMYQLPSFVQQDRELQEEIKTKISDAVDGMFLLARLYLASLDDKLTPAAIEEAMRQFRKQNGRSSEEQSLDILDHAYDHTMERIKGQKPGFREVAMKVIAWITCAKRRLTVVELQHALAVKAGDTELNQKNILQVSDMISVCAGLVTVDEESGIIRLVHYTTQEYFERTRMSLFPDLQTEMTQICVSYLSFNIFGRGFCQTHDEFEEQLESNHFFDYASKYWGHHACEISTLQYPLDHAILAFLRNKAKVEASSQGLFAIKRISWHSDYSQQVPRMLTGLHLAAYFGISTVIQQLLDTGQIEADSKDGVGWTPLSYAAENGNKAVVQQLLDTGALEVDSKDSDGRTPLSYAAFNGHEAVVQHLLDTGAVQADSKDSDGRTPLSYAALNGHEVVVQHLLDTGAVEADWKDTWGRTPLSLAALNGHEVVVQHLLDTGAVEADSKDTWGRTPLSYAALNGHEVVVQHLLDTGAVEADWKDTWGQTPLSYAALNGHEAVVQHLLDTGAVEADSKDGEGRTPLSYAVENGHKAVVQQLLDTGAVQADSKDSDGRTPLSYAAEYGHEAVVQQLLDTGAVAADLKDSQGRTPLSLATEKGHDAVAQLLRKRVA